MIALCGGERSHACTIVRGELVPQAVITPAKLARRPWRRTHSGGELLSSHTAMRGTERSTGSCLMARWPLTTASRTAATVMCELIGARPAI